MSTALAARGPVDIRPDNDQVRAFFDQWATFRKTVVSNCFCHREVYAALRQFLNSHHARAFTLVDLGCGDAATMTFALEDTYVSNYCGVDLSEVALQFARANAQSLVCAKSFFEGDYFEIVRRGMCQGDVIWIGLSFHHLSPSKQREFVSAAAGAVAPGGHLMIYDVFGDNGDPRETTLGRVWSECVEQCPTLTADELASIHEHMWSCDHPATVATLSEHAEQAGFEPPITLFANDSGLCRLLSMRRRRE